MSDLDNLKKENNSLKIELQELKAKLSSRNSAFDRNLERRVTNRYNELLNDIDRGIVSQLGDNKSIFDGKTMRFYSVRGDSYNGYKTEYHITIQNGESDKIKEKLYELELKGFQDSLDNFAWAVENK